MGDWDIPMPVVWAFNISGMTSFAISTPFVVHYCYKTIANRFTSNNMDKALADTPIKEHSIQQSKCTYSCSVIGLLFFALSSISYLFNIGAWIVYNAADPGSESQTWSIVWDAIGLGCYAVAIWTMLFTFLLRVKAAFDNSKCIMTALNVYVVIIGLLMFGIILLLAIGYNPGILGPLCLAMMIGFEVALLFLLSKKLLVMVKDRGNVNMEDSGNAVVDIDSFQTATKYTSLIVLGIVSTNVCCLLLAISIVVPWFNVPGGLLLAVDIFVNSTSLYLMFNFNFGSYKNYCSKYHLCVQNLCIGCAYNGTVKGGASKAEFAQLVLNADQTDQSPSSDC